MNRNIKKHQLWYAVALAGSTMTADVALSQQLEEVTVTARKRAEDLQSVPMAVSAFSDQQLQSFAINDITDVARMTPNLVMNETSGLVGGSISVFMRGIGNDQGLEQGVGIYVDDVYVSRTSGALFDIFDVERIEVLKGPQGNLYGRNTIGGAIKYITREPGEEFEGNVEVKVGSHGYAGVKGSVSGPLVADSLYGGVAFSYRQRDGYQDNSFPGSDDPWDADNTALRGTMVWQASDAVSVKLVADYSKDGALPPIPGRIALDDGAIAGINAVTTTANALFGAGTGVLDSPNDTSFPSDEDDVSSAFIDVYDDYEIEQSNVALTVEWDINDQWLLKSVTAGRYLEQVLPYDYDGVEQTWINTLRDGVESEDFSQEFQLNFSSYSVNAVMGLYYLDAKQTQDSNYTIQTPRLRAVQWHEKDTYVDDRDLESYSVYGNLDWDFAEEWQLSVGGRYTSDSKTEEQKATVNQGFYALALSSVTPPELPLAIMPGQEAVVEASPLFAGWIANTRYFEMLGQEENTSADDDWSEFTPSVRISHNLNDDSMVYGAISTGFKSGGFNRTGGNSTSYEPETVTTYALGWKSTMMDSTLRFNTELFYNEYEEKQLGAIQLLPDGTLSKVVSNVGEVTQYGGEFELSWLAPVDGLMFNFNLGYLSSEVDEFATIGDDGLATDISRTTELGYSPEWTGQFRVVYDVDLGNSGLLTLSSDVAYQDDMFTNSPIDTTNPLKTTQLSESHYLWNAVAAWHSNDDAWRVALEGLNLTDERVIVNSFDIGVVAAAGYNPPRTWTLSVGYSF